MPKSHQTGWEKEERMRLTSKAIASVRISHLLREYSPPHPPTPPRTQSLPFAETLNFPVPKLHVQVTFDFGPQSPK